MSSFGAWLKREYAARPDGIYEWAGALREQARAAISRLRCHHPREVWVRGAFSPPPPTGGFVYVLQPLGGGLVKIGKGRKVETRVARVQGDCPVPLTLVAVARGYGDVERYWHRTFKADRVQGEWFAPTLAATFARAMADAAPHGCARCVLIGDQL